MLIYDDLLQRNIMKLGTFHLAMLGRAVLASKDLVFVYNMLRPISGLTENFKIERAVSQCFNEI